jgi:hypothetical protein
VPAAGTRDLKADARADADLRGEPEAPAELLRHEKRLRQPEAAAHRAHVAHVARAPAEVHHRRDVAGRDAAAGVFDHEPQPHRILEERRGDAAAGLGVFAGVGDEVAQHVLKHRGHPQAVAVGALDLEIEVVVARLLLERGVVEDAVAAVAVFLDGGKHVQKAPPQLLDGELLPPARRLRAGEQFARPHAQDGEDGVEVGERLRHVGVRAQRRAGGEGGVDFSAPRGNVRLAVMRGGEALRAVAEVGGQAVAQREAAGEQRVVLREREAEEGEFAAQDVEDVEHAVHLQQRLLAGLQGRDLRDLDLVHEG